MGMINAYRTDRLGVGYIHQDAFARTVKGQKENNMKKKERQTIHDRWRAHNVHVRTIIRTYHRILKSVRLPGSTPHRPSGAFFSG